MQGDRDDLPAGRAHPIRFQGAAFRTRLVDWFARRDEPWGELVTMGPAGFEFYARVRYLEEDCISQRVPFACLRVHLAGRTNTPGGCFHGLRAGAVSGMHGGPARGIPPWFPASVLTGPKVRLPNREYLLFRGHLDELGPRRRHGPRDGLIQRPGTSRTAPSVASGPPVVRRDRRGLRLHLGGRIPGAHRRGHHRSEARRRARSPQLNTRDRIKAQG